MKAILNISASGVFLALCGCASLGHLNGANPLDRFTPSATQIDAVDTQTIAAQWSERAPTDLPTTDWVSYFGEPELTQIVNEALDRNTDIRAAAANWNAARASLTAARADRLPRVDFSGRAARSEAIGSDGFDNDNLSLGFNADWEADLWGRINDNTRAAALSLQAAETDYASARLSIAGQTTQSWFELIESHLLLDLAHKDLETQERSLRLTQRRFEGGVAPSTDVRLARSSVASAQANVASAKQSEANAARALEILLRRYPENALKSAQDLPQLPPLQGAGRPGDILAKRPDLIAAEQRLAVQGLRVDIARKNMLPRLSLSGDLNDNAGNIAELFDLDSLIAQLAANVSAPIFNAGELRAETERNEALLRAQLESYASDILTAYLEVENALNAEQRLLEREQALRISLEEAHEAEERLATRYVEGLATVLELLSANSRAITAEQSLITARSERLQNRVRLHMALGGEDFGQPTNLGEHTQLMAQKGALQ